ncbi:MAG: hypothetical protein WBM32_13385 [Crocosphaera sp.]
MALAEVHKQLKVQVASLFLFSKDGTIKRVGINGIDKEGNWIDNSWFPDEQYAPGESFSGRAVPPYDAESGYGEPQYSNQLEQEYSMINAYRYKGKLGELKCGISVPLNGSYRTFGTLEVLNKMVAYFPRIITQINRLLMIVCISSFIFIFIYSFIYPDKPIPDLMQNAFFTTLGWFGGILGAFFQVEQNK